MTTRNYWLDLFTAPTWQEFLDAGGTVSGFSENRRAAVEKIQPGDCLLCYLTGVSRFIGLLEVTHPAYEDPTPIWKESVFPCRVKVKMLVGLTPETAVPVKELQDRLSFFQNMGPDKHWSGPFRGSPTKWKAVDGQVVVEALLAAAENPKYRPVDANKLKHQPKAFRAKIGRVTVPEDDSATEQPRRVAAGNGQGQAEPNAQGIQPAAEKEPASHTEIQWILAKLGNDMGLHVWVARNDRGRQINGHRFDELPNLRAELPLQFEEATNRTIELIDVLWLRRNQIVAAFEIESTTSIYSGLLRMSDLIAMQPNINIPLYLVAPDDRREKVVTEINRPTFSRLLPPMADTCRFIAFSALRERLGQFAPVIRYLTPDFLIELSESCRLQ